MPVTTRQVGGGRFLPRAVTAAQAFSGDHDAELVEIAGQVIGEDRAAKDPSILVSSGKLVFLPDPVWPIAAAGIAHLRGRSHLKGNGICSVQSSARENRGGFLTPKSFRILLRSPGGYCGRAQTFVVECGPHPSGARTGAVNHRTDCRCPFPASPKGYKNGVRIEAGAGDHPVRTGANGTSGAPRSSYRPGESPHVRQQHT